MGTQDQSGAAEGLPTGDELSQEELLHLELDELDAAAGKGDAAAAPTPSVAEAEATRKGWRPKDKYEGDPEKWVDAETFLQRGERFASNLQKENAALKAKLDRFEITRKQFIEHQRGVMEQKDRELQDALRQLRMQRSEAQSEGDHERAIELEDRMEVLKRDREKVQADLEASKEETSEPAAAAAAPQIDPVLEAWIEDGNDWFAKDVKLRNYAVALGDELRQQGETLKGRQFLDKVRTLMEQEFPSRFGKSQRQVLGESGGSGAASTSRGKTARDLPAADRALMREFVAQGYITEEKFLKDYFSRNA